jgi:hypothetical protein
MTAMLSSAHPFLAKAAQLMLHRALRHPQDPTTWRILSSMDPATAALLEEICRNRTISLLSRICDTKAVNSFRDSTATATLP